MSWSSRRKRATCTCPPDSVRRTGLHVAGCAVFDPAYVESASRQTSSRRSQLWPPYEHAAPPQELRDLNLTLPAVPGHRDWTPVLRLAATGEARLSRPRSECRDCKWLRLGQCWNPEVMKTRSEHRIGAPVTPEVFARCTPKVRALPIYRVPPPDPEPRIEVRRYPELNEARIEEIALVLELNRMRIPFDWQERATRLRFDVVDPDERMFAREVSRGRFEIESPRPHPSDWELAHVDSVLRERGFDNPVLRNPVLRSQPNHQRRLRHGSPQAVRDLQITLTRSGEGMQQVARALDEAAAAAARASDGIEALAFALGAGFRRGP